MIRGNNVIKGEISFQLKRYVDSGGIEFRDGKRRNTCIIIVKENRIGKLDLDYLYTKLLTSNREIK